MGSPTTETSYRNDWETLHYVTLTTDYYIGIYPLTDTQARLASGNIYLSRSIKPVNGLGFQWWRGTPTASAYNWPANGHDIDPSKNMYPIRTLTGLEIDFPTEAQWEYACRAGTAGSLNDGTGTFDAAKGNLLGWSTSNTSAIQPVGLLKPNAWGLYDMHGNVWEWCLDQWQDHPDTPQIDPAGATDNMSKRVVKGGTYRTGLAHGRSAARRGVSVDKGYDNDFAGWIGFRPCCPAVIPAPED